MGKPALISSLTGSRRPKQAQLTHKARLYDLLSELSTGFVGLASGKVDSAIERTQQLMVEALGVDRSTLWQTTEGDSTLLLTHYFQPSHREPLPERFNAGEMLPWVHSKVISGEIVWFSSLDELPAEAEQDKASFRVHGPKASVIIPLRAGARIFGVLAFGCLNEERKWREEEIAELKLVAQIIGNVVARQRAELRAEQLGEELAHAMRVATLGELAAAFAHELNQPLTAILSNAQAARRFLQSDPVDLDEIRQIIDDIIRDDKRAGSVIGNLRDLVSKRSAIPDICFLNDILREVLALMHAELILEKIETRTKLASNLPELHVARVEMQQVMMNLLLNAVHAMEHSPAERRLIEIETSFNEIEVSVAIRDHGHGIPSDQLGRVFDPFFSTRANGLGMGLSICKRIIESYGGKIEAGNHPDGAVITFSLPVS